MAICLERAVLVAFHFFTRAVLFYPRLNCKCPFPVWCLGQDVEFDCIGSGSLPFYLLNIYAMLYLKRTSFDYK